jgi:hypothetical protein
LREIEIERGKRENLGRRGKNEEGKETLREERGKRSMIEGRRAGKREGKRV